MKEQHPAIHTHDIDNLGQSLLSPVKKHINLLLNLKLLKVILVCYHVTLEYKVPLAIDCYLNDFSPVAFKVALSLKCYHGAEKAIKRIFYMGKYFNFPYHRKALKVTLCFLCM